MIDQMLSQSIGLAIQPVVGPVASAVLHTGPVSILMADGDESVRQGRLVARLGLPAVPRVGLWLRGRGMVSEGTDGKAVFVFHNRSVHGEPR